MALGSTQPLTEMSTRNLLGVKGGRRLRLTTSPPSVRRLSRENVGASTSHNPMGLHCLLQGYSFTFTRGYKKLNVTSTRSVTHATWGLLWRHKTQIYAPYTSQRRRVSYKDIIFPVSVGTQKKGVVYWITCQILMYWYCIDYNHGTNSLLLFLSSILGVRYANFKWL
jgi:hypothetical protein